jgi:uncharacterized membrane protein YkvA (DUF1232 family)
MSGIIDTLLKVGGSLTALLLILLALPASKLRDFCLPIIAWTFSLACGLLVISPVDVIPDFIPIVGWIDDAGLAVAGIGSAIAALTFKRSS